MSKVKKIFAREILDSRGNPTVEVEILTDDEQSAFASVPSGQTTGSKEAVELRDTDADRYDGMGVLKAIENIDKQILPAVVGLDPLSQQELDQTLLDLDKTEHKSVLGANATLAVSLACCRLASQIKKIPLYQYIQQLLGWEQPFSSPTPMFNIINGGQHADNKLSFQEFMAVPTKPTTFKEKVREGTEIYHRLKKILLSQALNTAVGDEGGFSPNISDNEEAIKLILQAGKVNIALDIAGVGNDEISFWQKLMAQYPIIGIEDPLRDDDWQGWQEMTKTFDGKVLLIGDDIFATNPQLLQQGIKEKVANAVIIKPNQIGTLSETLKFIKIAKDANYVMIVSHRSGETEDTFISDLAVGCGAKYIKAGAPARGERVNKYNRLLRIEEELQR
ncbi:MAG: phosphopyruvate hydratase [Candidatus Nealsonbacteria bacterium CG23_combo_of_CG06-09_8_20_14_all_40_13]|uniref:Enolase n=1 Tax=Candidatus Nealsonbacteria bacterium CG23_combo_of_CG06-09_8_20_14_all_40_13 TaxID=1974724 RepID=A0A2G9YRV0_9BACT|nr:MAG: phosphopyruvate hydratase [Candidatus Nealsonbacteria bacterium CG23_combo_of_CG06-09_8_20_14_all_40_13]PIR70971.1 MAG: phosphopyruvate hydratase [Candidatus Nealsonbacteria bacterium CG10_big_fil_rev_8_21_14_0_10_40_24]PIU43033.1 MAG: phosphopyruvate hydratase [Candidatus Nealsonbacteria bacterium CG07_land_8_20_14_0_80_40_10]